LLWPLQSIDCDRDGCEAGWYDELEELDIKQQVTLILYIESSVISDLTTRASHDIVTVARQAIMLDWWRGKELISELLPFLVTSHYGL
jgi:hypothetical protein